ncbi:MAG: hypothetical protein E7491_01875 [Ruminococcaceae bacterium]|nr:hypothetical protein [Oscillospiraceae bacterium]
MKKFITILLAVLLCFAVVSCDGEKKDEKDIVRSIGNYCITENGIYHIGSESAEKLCFADFETGYDIILCNKPECMHAEYNVKTNPLPTCDAVTVQGEEYFGVIVYGDTLYTVEQGTNAYELYIRKNNFDGSGKKTVATIKGGFLYNGVTPIICANGYMYYIGYDYSAGMDEGKLDFNRLVETLYKIELSTGKVDLLIRKEAGKGIYRFENLYTDGDKLYYLVNDSTTEYDDATSSYQVKEWIFNLYSYDLQAGTEKRENADGENKGVVGFSNIHGIITEEYIEGKKVLTNNGKIIYESNDREMYFVLDDKLIVKNASENMYSIIDIKTAHIEKQFTGGSEIISGASTKYFVFKNIFNDGFSIVLKDDFYSGNLVWKEFKGT